MYRQDGRFRIDRELSRLATRAVWALGSPLPSSERGLPVMVPDPTRLTEGERQEVIPRTQAAMAAAPPEILERSIHTADEPLDSDLGDVDAVAAWLDHHHPGRTVSVVVEHDLFGRLRDRVREAARKQVPLSAVLSRPGEFRAVQVDTADKVEDAALNEAARQALVALGWRHDFGLPETPWTMSWSPAVMSDGFKVQAVARVERALRHLKG